MAGADTDGAVGGMASGYLARLLEWVKDAALRAAGPTPWPSTRT